MRPVEAGDQPVLDHRSNAGVPTQLAEVAQVVTLAAQQDVHRRILPISLDELPADLTVVRFAGKTLHVEYC
jgi:hypothetical protein